MLMGDSEKKAEAQADSQLNVPAAITDAGCERELNEDRYAVIESPSGLAWLVCDGMGGAAGGELAAQLALDAVRRELESMPARAPEEALRAAILQANRIIVLRRQNQAFAQMGTTVVAALFSGPEVIIGHAGDSRAYLIRDGAIQQLSTDHTYVQGLVDKGQIKIEEALSHPDAHILTRCIGSEPGLVVDMSRFWIWEMTDAGRGDILMLCTDGLYSQVTDGEMANLVSQFSPQEACVKLVEIAKARGGYDNITVAIVPLGGQLKQEPPIGYDPKVAIKRRLDSMRVKNAAPRNWTRDIMVILSLCLLSFFLTALVMIFMINQ